MIRLRANAPRLFAWLLLALALFLGQTLAAAHGVLHPDHTPGQHQTSDHEPLCAAADLLSGGMAPQQSAPPASPTAAPALIPFLAAAPVGVFPGWFHSRAPPSLLN